jgi:CBS domain-containing protein
MRISDVLASKGRKVETVWPSQPVGELPRLMIDRNIASVVVVDHGGMPMGLVTDRHVMQALARHGSEALQRTAGDIMQSPPPSCTPADEVAEVMRRMTEERARHFLVTERGLMVGLVSIGDLVKSRLRDADLEARVLREIAHGHLAEAQKA